MLRGSSPRVRSRPYEPPHQRDEGGIISACAEQTAWRKPSASCRRDHLRVCGADSPTAIMKPFASGSSPRVRSRQRLVRRSRDARGIISACAEQTFAASSIASPRWDHLRVCGADFCAAFFTVAANGSSPRVRSRQRLQKYAKDTERIISACAEQTGLRRSHAPNSWDHLRVCGADPIFADLHALELGSSPRVRSRHPVIRRMRR